MEVKGIELNKRLENIIDRMNKDLPRVLGSVSAQNDEILNFKSVIENARGVVNSQNVKSTSLQSLAILDRAIERVKATQVYLKDADNWNTVSAEMESLFAAQDLEKASLRLVEAERSLKLMMTNPNAKNVDSRKDLLSSLRCRLLSSLRVDLSNYILNNNFTDAKSILKLHETIDSLQDARLVLFEIKQATLSVLWPSIKTVQEISILLREFEEYFQDLLFKLSSDCLPLFSSVFPETYSVEIQLLVGSVLSKLNPHFSLHLEHLEREEKESFIIPLTQLYQTIVQFGARIEESFPVKSIGGNDQYGKGIFEAFVPYQKKYEVYEKAYLEHVLRFEVFDLKNLSNFIQIAESVRSRFLSFTFGLIRLDFESLIDRFLTDVLEKAVQLLTQSSPSNEDGDFASLIGNLEAAIVFCKRLNNFWNSLPIILKDSSLASTCKSSSAVLKSLRRDFHMFESSRVCQSAEKASEFVVLWQNRALQSLIAPVDVHLENVEKLPAWSKGAPSNDMQFSLSPLPYITQIGEFTLTLPQAFEPFSQDDLLNYYLRSLPFIERELAALDNQEGGELIYEPIHIWIISSVRIIEEKLVDAVLKISYLSISGLKQLQADLGYFRNVMLAVDIEPQERFRDLAHAVNLDESALALEIESESVHSLDLMKCILSIRKKEG